MSKTGIYIGVGGWTYDDWRGSFYPDKLPQRRELEYASSQLSSIEINGTYYGSQKRESFAKWHDETPEGFIFSVKGPRFATNRRVLAEAGSSIEKFFESGVTALKKKLGPINWQFMATKKFDPNDFEAFLKLLPKKVDGFPIRHAVEVRNPSFAVPEFVELAREYKTAIIMAADSEFPQIGDVTAPFVYARIMGTSEDHALGYQDKDLKAWAKRVESWASGKHPKDIKLVASAKTTEAKPRDVFLYVISGFKVRNPLAAKAMIAHLGGKS